MILRIASILLPIFAIVAVGYRYGRRHDPEMAVAIAWACARLIRNLAAVLVLPPVLAAVP